MNMILTILVCLFIVFAASRVILRYKDKQVSGIELIMWTIIWGLFLIVALFPDLTNEFANILGINRGVDIVLYISIVLLFYLVFRLYVKIDKQEQNLTLLTRRIARNNANSSKNKSTNNYKNNNKRKTK